MASSSMTASSSFSFNLPDLNAASVNASPPPPSPSMLNTHDFTGNNHTAMNLSSNMRNGAYNFPQPPPTVHPRLPLPNSGVSPLSAANEGMPSGTMNPMTGNKPPPPAGRPNNHTGPATGNTQTPYPFFNRAAAPLPIPAKQRRVQTTPAPDPSIPPNNTIYINNLNDSVKTAELKENLKGMFKQFGEIKEIIAMKSFWRRGQAWIVFKNVSSATKALHGMQGFLYHGQNMRINYSHSKSDCIAKEDGTFVPRPSGPKKPRAVQEREKRHEALLSALQQQYLEQLQSAQSSNTASSSRADSTTSTNTGVLQLPNAGGSKDTDKQAILAAVQARAAETLREVNKRRELDAAGVNPLNNFNMFQLPGQQTMDFAVYPNKLLFVENLPEDATEELVSFVFRQHNGFIEARVIPGRRIAFVDYENEMDAGIAMNALQNYSLNGSPLKISYAKR